MKIKKKYSFKDKRQIWRLLITDTDLLIIETRSVESREVYFNCIDIHSGKKKFNNIQMEEKSWIGIEMIYKDIIFFHQYAKPDMPEHRRILAYDINQQKYCGKMMSSHSALLQMILFTHTSIQWLVKNISR